jgi:hypothetical protein
MGAILGLLLGVAFFVWLFWLVNNGFGKAT